MPIRKGMITTVVNTNTKGSTNKAYHALSLFLFIFIVAGRLQLLQAQTGRSCHFSPPIACFLFRLITIRFDKVHSSIKREKPQKFSIDLSIIQNAEFLYNFLNSSVFSEIIYLPACTNASVSASRNSSPVIFVVKNFCVAGTRYTSTIPAGQ